MKKILLVNPNSEKAPYPVAPIGLGLVATQLAARFQVIVYDGTFQGAAGFRETLASVAPDFVGITIRNVDDVTFGSGLYYIDDIKKLYVDVVREMSDAPIVLGGAGYSLFPVVLLTELEADFGVVGEAEITAVDLFTALENGADPTALPNVLRRGDRSPRVPAPPPEAGVLEIPFSSVDRFVDFTPYRARGTYPVQTKRGCHLKCVYCSYPLIEGRNYRLREPTVIVDEIAQARERLGDVVFELVDSTFNAPRGHAERICEEIVRRGLDIRIRCMGANPGSITDGLLALMRAAGFVQIVCSADTASPTMLRSMGKSFTREKLESVASLLRKHDMPTMWSIILGGPEETEETLAETFDFIERSVYELDMVHVTVGIRIYPNTPIHGRAVADGIIEKDDPILQPVFYISPLLGKERLLQIVAKKSLEHLNCVRAEDSTPDPEMVREAMAVREREALDEPMFRTLLRVRRKRHGK